MKQSDISTAQIGNIVRILELSDFLSRLLILFGIPDNDPLICCKLKLDRRDLDRSIIDAP